MVERKKDPLQISKNWPRSVGELRSRSFQRNMVLACGIFKGIQSRHLLLLFLVIDLTRTRVLWCRNRLFCQLVHNHCPTMQMFKGSSSRCTSSLMIKNCCVASFVRSFDENKQTFFPSWLFYDLKLNYSRSSSSRESLRINLMLYTFGPFLFNSPVVKSVKIFYDTQLPPHHPSPHNL